MVGPIFKRGLCGCVSLTNCVKMILFFEVTVVFLCGVRSILSTTRCDYDVGHIGAGSDQLIAFQLKIATFNKFMCENDGGIILSAVLMTTSMAQAMMLNGIILRRRSFMIPYLCLRLLGIILGITILVALHVCLVVVFHLDVLMAVILAAFLLMCVPGVDIFIFLHMISLYVEFGKHSPPDHEMGIQESAVKQGTLGITKQAEICNSPDQDVKV